MNHAREQKAAWLLLALLLIGGAISNVPFMWRSFRPKSGALTLPDLQNTSDGAQPMAEIAYPIAEASKQSFSLYWMKTKIAFYQADGPFSLFDSGDERCPNRLLKARCDEFVIP